LFIHGWPFAVSHRALLIAALASLSIGSELVALSPASSIAAGERVHGFVLFQRDGTASTSLWPKTKRRKRPASLPTARALVFAAPHPVRAFVGGLAHKAPILAEIGASTAPDLDALALLASEDAEAVMFHFMQPSGAGRRAINQSRLTRADEPGRQVADVVTPAPGNGR